LWSRRALSGGSRLGVWWGQSIKWVLKSPYVFNSTSLFVTIVGNHTKVVNFYPPRKWLFLLLELCGLSWKHHRLKSPCIINSQKAWSSSKKIGPIFRKLHIPENAVGVPNNLISTISVWKIYIDPVVPQNFVTADRSTEFCIRGPVNLTGTRVNARNNVSMERIDQLHAQNASAVVTNAYFVPFS